MLEITRDLKDIVCCSLRYALGRRTYITSLISDYIMEHSELVDSRVKQVLLRDLEWYFHLWETGKQIDDKCDYETWYHFKKWLEKLELEDEI